MNAPASGPQSATRAEVESLIPHRAPFLFVDEILERHVGPDVDHGASRIRVAWHVRADSDFYRGHYPGRPVTPGVILSEHAFQAGALLVSLALGGFTPDGGVPVLTRIESAKFKRMVEPGASVETTVEVADRLGPAWYMKATVRVGGSVAVQLRYVLSTTAAMSRVGRNTDGAEA